MHSREMHRHRSQPAKDMQPSYVTTEMRLFLTLGDRDGHAAKLGAHSLHAGSRRGSHRRPQLRQRLRQRQTQGNSQPPALYMRSNKWLLAACRPAGPPAPDRCQTGFRLPSSREPEWAKHLHSKGRCACCPLGRLHSVSRPMHAGRGLPASPQKGHPGEHWSCWLWRPGGADPPRHPRTTAACDRGNGQLLCAGGEPSKVSGLTNLHAASARNAAQGPALHTVQLAPAEGSMH